MLRRLDAVERAAEREIKQYRASSFEACLTVEISIRRDKTRFGLLVNGKLFKAYILQIFGEPDEQILAKPGPVVVSILRGHQLLTNVEQIMHTASKLPNPLDEIDIPVELRQARACEAQRRWWAINGKSFGLLQLPRELRELIYSQLCGLKIMPYLHRSSRIMHMGDMCLIAMMLTNRQIHHEVSDHISVYKHFYFRHKSFLRTALQDPSLMARIKHLCLAFEPDHYLLFFGTDSDACQRRLLPDPQARRLRRLTLTSLRISLMASHSTRASSVDLTSDLCCRCIRLLIMEVVWPYVRGHACSLSTDFAPDERAFFASRATAERSRYIDWRQGAAAQGLPNVTLEAWDGWVAWFDVDFDGGVSVLDGVKSVQPQQSESLTCCAESWSP